MKFLSSLSLLCVLVCFGQAADKFPAGRKTAEGAACELARAFINHDYKLFKQLVVPVYGGPEVKKEYSSFLDMIKKSMAADAKKPGGAGPKSIETCFAARSLSRGGPASYADTLFGYKDLKFVDVKVVLRNGKTALNRTLVMQEPSGNWVVHPCPTISPLLSMGLNEETASTIIYKPNK